MNLPTRGLCHSVFLLAYAVRSKERHSVSEWIAAARRTPTYMANALAIDSAAEHLMCLGLAKTHDDRVSMDERLLRAGSEASTQTLAVIAQVLLQESPPGWIHTAVADGEVRSELIPTSDECSLSWLEGLRDPLLLELKARDSAGDRFRAWLGSIGECLVVESEISCGRRVTHVALLSDAFGYDIESRGPSGRVCIEVKTTLESASNRFFITRNEVEKARRLNSEWQLVQVVLKSDVLAADFVSPQHVVAARCLKSYQVCSLAPQDTNTGTWVDSARINPPDDAWVSWSLSVHKGWSYPAYRAGTS